MSLSSRHDAGTAYRISGPGELVQAVPYLLGFHPRRSLVLVGLHDGMLVVTARLDLDEVAPPLLDDTVRAMCEGGTTELIAAVWDDDAGAAACAATGPDDLPWAAVFDALELPVQQRGADLIDALLVADGLLWSYTCDDERCCPAEGRPMPSGPSEFVTAATYSGVVALPNREAVGAVLTPLAEPERARLQPLIDASDDDALAAARSGGGDRWARSAKRAIFAMARCSAAPRWSGPPDAEVARFAVALSEAAVRDAVWLAVDDGRLDGRPLWRDLARRLPAPYDAAPLFLFGWAAWRAGDGALAGMAAERAVTSDPGYTAADLLLAALSRGVDPRRLPKLRLPHPA